MKRAILGIVLFWGIVTSAFSTTINVPADQPTIQAGISSANQGDTILVSSGIYIENINFEGKMIVVSSLYGAETTTIQALDTLLPTVSINSNETKGTELSGFTITGSGSSGILCNGSSPLIKNNIIAGNSSFRNNDGGGISLKNTTSSVITNNKIFNNDAYSYGAAIHMGDDGSSCSYDTISYNLIYDNTGIGEIRCLGNLLDIVINNNTISVTTHSGIIGNAFITARNNIIFFAKESAFQGDIYTYYNCTFANVQNFSHPPDLGNITLDAEFIDTTTDNYYLSAISPCINAGDPNPIYNDDDGTRNDIGALRCSLGDSDSDGVNDCYDLCLGFPDTLDGDFDGVPDGCDICNGFDDTLDSDFDSIPDGCDKCPDFDDYIDSDFDSIPDQCDNCPSTYNTNQNDYDGDNIGDGCDVCMFDSVNDIDSDGVCGDVDNCPTDYNNNQNDADEDGLGDVCDVCIFDSMNDIDSDGVCGDVDNCPTVTNPLQEDTNGDGVGDACEACCIGIRGNVNYDVYDEIDISDLVYFLDYSFRGGPEPVCEEEADVTGSGDGLDISEIVYLVNYMFKGGPAPVECP